MKAFILGALVPIAIGLMIGAAFIYMMDQTCRYEQVC